MVTDNSLFNKKILSIEHLITLFELIEALFIDEHYLNKLCIYNF